MDDCLPDCGWPRAAVIELQLASIGIGELGLLLPLLIRLSQSGLSTAWITLINPPAIPYPHALAAAGVELDRLLIIHDVDSDQALWATEQSLRCGHSALVLLWQSRILPLQWRRLQLAAEAGDSSGFIWQPPGSPARHVALSLSLEPAMDGITLNFNGGRGSLRQRRLTLPSAGVASA